MLFLSNKQTLAWFGGNGTYITAHSCQEFLLETYCITGWIETFICAQKTAHIVVRRSSLVNAGRLSEKK